MKRLIPVLVILTVAFAVHAQEFPHGDYDGDCENCHSDDSWSPTLDPLPFKHADAGFPLAGSHKKVKCRSCHTTLDFPKVATACADCHRDTHRGEFGFRCESCHLPRSWDNRRQMWDRHSATLFPLTGAHATLDCQSCHREEPPFRFALTSIDCIDCHAADYAATTDPDHQAASFPTDCQICHGTTSWDARGFPDHDANFFPINSGPHAGAWSSCTDCHTMPGNFTFFDCTNCHEHRESEMAEEHDDVPGYVWESNACLNCHPNGREK